MDISFIISKLLAHFILPPGIFVVIFALLALFCKKHRAKLVFLGLITWAVSTPYLVHHLQSLSNDRETEAYDINQSIPNDVDAVVVLGLGIDSNSPAFNLPSQAFRNTIYAVMLAKNLDIPLIYSGGGVWEIAEAEAAREDIKKIFGDNYIDIYYEAESLNTEENAENTKKLTDTLSIHNPKIVLITSGWHIKRAQKVFEANGFSVTPRPTSLPDRDMSKKEFVFRDFLPDPYALASFRNISKEFLGELKATYFSF
ncbi:MAG: YdcF family protein [Campylobacterales bacterium]